MNPKFAVNRTTNSEWNHTNEDLAEYALNAWLTEGSQNRGVARERYASFANLNSEIPTNHIRAKFMIKISVFKAIEKMLKNRRHELDKYMAGLVAGMIAACEPENKPRGLVCLWNFLTTKGQSADEFLTEFDDLMYTDTHLSAYVDLLSVLSTVNE